MSKSIGPAFSLFLLAGPAATGALAGCGGDGLEPADRIEASDDPLRLEVPICPAGLAAQGRRCVPRDWTELAPLPVDAARVADVLDFDGAHLWLVGRGGLVLRSQDGGRTVGHVLAGTEDDLSGVDSYDDRHLLLTSAAAGRIHISDDGGVRFRTSAAGPAGLGKCTYAPGAAAVCDGGFRYDLRTDSFSTVAPGARLVRVANWLGLALVPGAASTQVLRSTDGGRSFAPGPVIPAVATGLWLAPGDALGLVGTRGGEVYRTTDGGVSFARVLAAPQARNVLVAGADRTHLYASAVLPVDTEDGAFLIARIYASADGGATFSELAEEVIHEADPGAARLVPLSFGAPDHGLWIGETLHGVAVSNVLQPDGLIETDRPQGPRELAFPTAERGYVLVTARHPNPPGTLSAIFRTADGGARFARVFQVGGLTMAPPFGPLHGLFAADEDHVFVRGTAVRDPLAPDELFRSNDGGATWLSGAPFPFDALAYGSALRGLRLDGGGVLRTDDGAATWTPVALPGAFTPRAVAFSDADHAALVGDDGAILASDDGGRSFTVRRGGPAGQTLSVVAFQRGGPAGWAAGEAGGGGVLLRSRDNGQSWAPQAFPGSATSVIRELRAFSARAAEARAVDAMGGEFLLKTSDGNHWVRRALPPLSLAGLDGTPRATSAALRPGGRSVFAATETGVYRHEDPPRP